MGRRYIHYYMTRGKQALSSIVDSEHQLDEYIKCTTIASDRLSTGETAARDITGFIEHPKTKENIITLFTYVQ